MIEPDGKVEVYEFRGHYFVAKDGEVFELADEGLVRLCADSSDATEPVLVHRPHLMWAVNVTGDTNRTAPLQTLDKP